jgi:5-methylcytosine-specific restriction protein A
VPVPWQHSKPTTRVIVGRELQREIKWLKGQYPLCPLCLREGIIEPSAERDHIIPLAEGGRDERENTWMLCVACHKAKTQEEAKRGKWRMNYGR